jgi:hypothetical protein
LIDNVIKFQVSRLLIGFRIKEQLIIISTKIDRTDWVTKNYPPIEKNSWISTEPIKIEPDVQLCTNIVKEN